MAAHLDMPRALTVLREAVPRDLDLLSENRANVSGCGARGDVGGGR